MRLWLAIVVGIAACGADYPQSRIFMQPNLPTGEAAAPTPPLTAMTLRLNYDIQGVPRLPDVHTDFRGVGECHVVASGAANGCSMVCTLGDGGALCETLTDPHTATCVDTPWGKGYDITSETQAVVCDSAELRRVWADDGGTGVSGPETSLVVALPRASPTGGVNWLFDFFSGTGPNYRQNYIDRTGAEAGAIGTWCAPAADKSNTLPVDAWATFTCAYNGGSGGAALSIGTQLAIEDVGNVARGAMHSGSKLTIGANDAHNGARYALDGIFVGFATFAANLQTTGELVLLNDTVFGVGSDAGHLTPTQSATVQGDTVDWIAVTGSIEPVWTPVGMVDPTLGGGLRSIADRANRTATVASTISSMVDVGVVVVNDNTSTGWWSVPKGGTSTMDEVVCASANCGKLTLEHFDNWDGGYEPSWYWLGAGAKAGLTGVERTKVDLTIVHNGSCLMLDGGTTCVCPFTGLTSTETRVECAAKITGATSVKAKFTAPAAGSFQLDTPLWITGPHREPWWGTSTQRPSTYYTCSVANFPDLTAGARVETVFVAPDDSSTYTLGFPTNGGTLYLVDMKEGADHSGAFLIANYPASDGGTGIGNLLAGMERGPQGSRLESPGHTIVRGQPYAFAIEARTHSGTCADGGAVCCDLRMYFNACSGVTQDGGVGCVDATNGDAVTLVTSSLDGSKTCPEQPTACFIANRNSLVVPTSASYPSPLRIYTP